VPAATAINASGTATIVQTMPRRMVPMPGGFRRAYG